MAPRRTSTHHLGPWCRLYVSILDDPKLSRLTDAQYRGWSKMLALAKFHGGRIPDDIYDIAHRLRLTEGKVRDLLQILISAELFDYDGHFYTPHNWTERQFESDVSTERVKRFRNGNETFHETPDTVSETVNETSPYTEADTETETETESISSDAPHPDVMVTQVRALKAKPKTTNGHAYLGDFPSFYDAFPRHEGRGQAEKAYCAARKAGATASDLLAASMRYAAQRAGEDPKYTRLPATWLNGKCWLDQPETGAESTQPNEFIRRIAEAEAKASV